jgi:hypothetical protein
MAAVAEAGAEREVEVEAEEGAKSIYSSWATVTSGTYPWAHSFCYVLVYCINRSCPCHHFIIICTTTGISFPGTARVTGH